MDIASTATLKPRKMPSQARAKVTVAAIFAATIQLLKQEGVARLTTTRIAERAGVSVGTMYQYFPHKTALLYAVLQQHLDVVASAIEEASRRSFGKDIASIIEELVTSYLDIKALHLQESQALYSLANDRDSIEVMRIFSMRLETTVADLLDSAADTVFANSKEVSFTVVNAMKGTTRALIERGTVSSFSKLRRQMLLMVTGYLSLAGSPGGLPRGKSPINRPNRRPNTDA